MSRNLIYHAYHIVFSTKNHHKTLRPEVLQELPAYLAGVAKAESCFLIEANGVCDHIHILIDIPPTKAVSDVIRSLKANSSRWISERFNMPFEWQAGYGSFTVSCSTKDKVQDYIRQQEEHHKVKTLTEELEAYAKKFGVDLPKDL